MTCGYRHGGGQDCQGHTQQDAPRKSDSRPRAIAAAAVTASIAAEIDNVDVRSSSCPT
jgi:hypothetical protein